MSHVATEMVAPAPLAPVPGWRRIVCACGCGRWFYWQRAKHRPPSYATPECYARGRAIRRGRSGLSGRGER